MQQWHDWGFCLLFAGFKMLLYYVKNILKQKIRANQILQIGCFQIVSHLWKSFFLSAQFLSAWHNSISKNINFPFVSINLKLHNQYCQVYRLEYCRINAMKGKRSFFCCLQILDGFECWLWLWKNLWSTDFFQVFTGFQTIEAHWGETFTFWSHYFRFFIRIYETIYLLQRLSHEKVIKNAT